METKKFTPVHLNHLTIDDLFALNKSSIGFAIPVRDVIGELLKIILSQLETNNNAMGMQMKKALKNVLTPELIDMNTDRIDRFAEIKRNVSTSLKGREQEKKTAAENMKVFLDPYWDTNKKALNTQTGLLNELFGKFNASATLKAHAATIGITGMMAGLETVNTEYGALYKTRNQQDAALQGPSASSLRAAATESYEQFCVAVEQAIKFTSSETFITLFGQLDQLRKTYARLIHKKDKEQEASLGEAE